MDAGFITDLNNVKIEAVGKNDNKHDMEVGDLKIGFCSL